MAASSYQFLECQGAACRLRFPGGPGVPCPLCRAETTVAALRAPNPAVDVSETRVPMQVLLDNIRSAYNVGSIIRTADGTGVNAMAFCGITPGPDHPSVRKTSLGAEEHLAWSRHNNGLRRAEALVDAGVRVWSVERARTSQNLFELNSSDVQGHGDARLALVFGNEVVGVDPGILDVSERILHIPMRGHKDSLNVATSAGIALYTLAQLLVAPPAL